MFSFNAETNRYFFNFENSVVTVWNMEQNKIPTDEGIDNSGRGIKFDPIDPLSRRLKRWTRYYEMVPWSRRMQSRLKESERTQRGEKYISIEMWNIL